MPSGGARVGAGRRPDPESLRALDRAESYGDWIELPVSGRKGRVPAWPLPTATNAAERKLWNKLWKSPQAIMWEKHGQELQVAFYVRRAIEADQRGIPASLQNAVQRLADTLGITLIGQRGLRWRIVDREAAAKDVPAEPAKKKRTKSSSSKQRLTVVNGDR